MMLKEYLSKLNSEQLTGVTHDKGPALIVAGAGTGKTTVIANRILWLLENKKCKPEEFLALTFTEKTAAEMEERIDRLLPYGYVNLWIHTFHGFCEKILRQYGLDIGLSTDFKVLNETGSWILIRQNLDEFDLDYYRPLANPTKFIYALIKHFSRCKDELIRPKEYLDFVENMKLNADGAEIGLLNYETLDTEKNDLQKYNEIAECYQKYQQLLLKNNYLDFGDLQLYAFDLLKKRPNILSKIREQFKYTLVDEFQDTNTIQYNLIKNIVLPQNNLMVVGDDDQSIYKFRGASISNIMQFKNDFPTAKEVVLTQNYRSSQNILDTAYKSIRNNNPNRLEEKLKINKKLTSKTNEQGVVEHLHGVNIDHEVNLVLNKILQIKKSNNALWSDFAILVRANNNALPFIKTFESQNIPYHFFASKGLYLKPVILDAIAFLKIMHDENDDSALFRLLNIPVFHIKYDDIVKITNFSYKKGQNLYGSLQSIAFIKDISPESVNGINLLVNLIKSFKQTIKNTKVSELYINFIKKSGYLNMIKSADDAQSYYNLNYLQQFLNIISNFEKTNSDPNLKNFAELVKMENEAGETGSISMHDIVDSDKINIMTVHAAKGLEFPYVFLVNLVDKRFPTTRKKDPIEIPDELLPKKEQTNQDVHLQEERRLFYVALTRAKNHLYLTSAENYGGVKQKKSSIFLNEIDLEHINAPSLNQNAQLEQTWDKIKPNNNYSFKIKNKFSFSSLRDFENCPLLFKYKHLLKIPTFGTSSMSFGSSIHKTLELFVQKYMRSRDSKQQTLFGEQCMTECITLAENDLLSLYNQSWIDEWYETKKTEDKYKKLGLTILKSFYQKFIETKPNPIFTEMPFNYKISEFIIRGRIDRIDNLGKDSYSIIDYKTGAPKEKLAKEDKRQLILYQMAFNSMNPNANIELKYYFLANNSIVEFQAKEKDIIETQKWIIDSVNSIHTSGFEATPGMHCSFCPYNDLCEYKSN